MGIKFSQSNFKRFLLKGSFFLTCLFLISKVYAQNISLSAEATQQIDDLFYHALSILPLEKIPTKYQAEVQNVAPIKCATVHYMQAMREIDRFTPEQRSVLMAAFSRPILPFSHPSENGKFRIHYTLTGFDAVSGEDENSNGVPDYVEIVAETFEASRAFENDSLGFQHPPSDGNIDGSEYDVYIQGLGFGGYGTTTSETVVGGGGDGVPSYIIVDNDFENGQFTNGLQGLQVAAAHEYMHAIQFGYRNAFLTNEFFYYELCASWVEDVVYDEVNDYLGSVPSYLRDTDKPFNQFNLFFNFGAAIWNHFLQEKYNRTDFVRMSWALMGNGEPVLDAIKGGLLAINGNFDSDFAEFALWNYFTGSRADAINFYDEGATFSEINFEDEFIFRNDTTLTDSTLTLSYKYYKFTTTEPGDYLVTGSAEKNQDWQIAAIIGQQGQATQIFSDSFERGLNLGSLPISSEIVLIPVYLKALDGSNSFAFGTTFGNYQVSLLRFDLQGEQNTGVRKIFPNPFIVGQHTTQTFQFHQVTTIDLEVHILNFSGKVVRTVSFGNNADLNPAGFEWDGRDDDGNFVSSGIYIIHLKQGENTDFVKFAVVNK